MRKTSASYDRRLQKKVAIEPMNELVTACGVVAWLCCGMLLAAVLVHEISLMCWYVDVTT
jgi:hypothetical protein